MTRAVSPDFDQVALLYRIVRRLWRDVDVGFSRNQNFEAYDDPTVQRALRIARILQDLERDLLKLAKATPHYALLQVEPHTQPEGLTLTLKLDDARRQCTLTWIEWSMLLECPEVLGLIKELSQTHPNDKVRQHLLQALDRV